ncbi:MAG: hypothetical protein F2923_06960 [Actinobacteria bacterium]|uniref:Unannotated protein n=1 Tax=freshwater metagenome TaxID=449393 RepID=A0A6J7SL38_9ZZZZ|nr:hypothetical protein [Actinomycetota bacterium]MTB28366.1 hypothetical protein [Actinomycetota bacterium]
MVAEATELGALRSTRLWLIIVGTCVWITTTLLIVRHQWTHLSAVEHALIMIGLFTFIVAIAMYRYQYCLWLFPIGQLCFLACAFVAPDSSPNWLALMTLSSWLTYFLVGLTSRKIGFMLIPTGALITIVAWKAGTSIVIPGALEVFGGWVVFAQSVGGAAALWWAWNTLKDEAVMGDARTEDLENQTNRSLELQERARTWRQGATRVHESVLNTVRYVLLTQNLDRGRLKQETVQASSNRNLRNSIQGSTAEDLVNEVAQVDFEGNILEIQGSIPDLYLDSEVYQTLRAAIIELIRNVIRHADDKNISLSISITSQLELAINILGGTQLGGHTPPGIGRNTVLGSALDEIGATWLQDMDDRGRGKSAITIPISDLMPHPNDNHFVGFPPFDKARLIVSSPLAGMSVIGSIYFIREMVLDRGFLDLGGWFGLVGVVMAAALVLRRKPVNRWLGALMVVVPALVPILVLQTDFQCSQSGLMSPILTISGYAVMVIAAWSGRFAGILGLSIWAYGGFALVMRFPSNCRDSVSIALLNSLVVLPIILIVSFIGARAYRKAADRTRAVRQLDVIERSRAAAAEDLNAQLDDAISMTLDLLDLIADGAELDTHMHEQLEIQDGRIRSAIQVDPARDGAFAVVMRALVEEAAELGVRTNVKALVSSHDSRPIDSKVERLLYQLLLANQAQGTQVQVFTDGVEDHLVLAVSRPSLRAAGLRPGERRTVGDVNLQVEQGEVDPHLGSRHAVIVSRRILTPT